MLASTHWTTLPETVKGSCIAPRKIVTVLLRWQKFSILVRFRITDAPVWRGRKEKRRILKGSVRSRDLTHSAQSWRRRRLSDAWPRIRLTSRNNDICWFASLVTLFLGVRPWPRCPRWPMQRSILPALSLGIGSCRLLLLFTLCGKPRQIFARP